MFNRVVLSAGGILFALGASGAVLPSSADVFSPLPPGAVTLKGGLDRDIRKSIGGWILGGFHGVRPH